MNDNFLYLKTRAICILVFFTLISNAQSKAGLSSPATLQQCIDYALKNNISIKQNHLNLEYAKLSLLQSETGILPNINGNASHNYNFGQTIDPFTNKFATDKVLSQNFYLSSSIVVFNGLRNYNTIKQNQFALAASKYDDDKMKNDISLNVAIAYLQILFNQELLTIATDQTNITNKQVDRTKKLVEAGNLPKGSILDIQAQLASEELVIVNAQNQLDLSYLSLAQLLYLDSANGFSIVKPDLNISSDALLTSNPTQIFSIAISTLPEIKSSELKLKSAERALAASKGLIYPKLILNGSFGTGYSGARLRPTGEYIDNGLQPSGAITATTHEQVLVPSFTPLFEKMPFSDQFSQNANKSIGLYLSIPIFNGLSTKTTIDRAKIAMQNSQYNMDLAKIQLKKTIQQAYADASAALKKYHATLKALEALQEAFKYTQEKFNVGILNTLDYNISKNKLSKAQSDLLQAKYDYVFKTKILDFYQGKPLTI